MELAIILSEWLRNPGKGLKGEHTPDAPRSKCTFGASLGNWSVLILDPPLILKAIYTIDSMVYLTIILVTEGDMNIGE